MITDWSKEGGISGFDIECDDCGTTDFIEEDLFHAMISEAKNRGWKIFKDYAGDWTHLCPDCARKD